MTAAINYTHIAVPTLQVEPREAVVAAGGGLDVLVRVLVDDNITFRDVLHVLVSEGADVNIPLEATGPQRTQA